MSNLGDILRQVVCTPKHIPDDWQFYKLTDICNPKQWKTISAAEMTESGYPVFGANGFVGFYHEYNHEHEAVAITCRGNTCGTINRIPPKTYITGNSMALDDIQKNVITQDYLYYALKYRGVGDSISGSAQPQITGAGLRSIEFPAPPLPEQQKIATILSSVDDVIEKTRSQIDKLKDLKTSMMQELLTEGIGHTEFKDSPVGFIPINWEVKQIGEMVVKVGSGITPRGGSASYVDVGIPLIRSQNVHSDGLRLDNVSYITKTQHAKMSGSQLKPCDVLLNITGASIGRCYYLPSDFKEGNVNQHVCIIRLKQKILDSVFLTFCLNSESGQRQIMSLQAGGNREGLNFQQVRAIRLPVPPLDEQKKIAEIVSSIEKNICNKLAKLAHMSDTKKALMQDLLTGKVRVTPNESAAL